jgi:hypothetical protein
MQESNSCFTSDLDVFLLPIMSLSASPESQVAQRHSAPTSAMSHRGDLDTSTSAPKNLAPSRGGHCGVEGAQSSLQSATQRGRHRGQSHRGQRPVDRLTRANTLFARRLHICWEGSPISLSWMCPRRPPSQQEHTIVSSKVRSWGCLRGLHPHGLDASLESALP